MSEANDALYRNRGVRPLWVDSGEEWSGVLEDITLQGYVH